MLYPDDNLLINKHMTCPPKNQTGEHTCTGKTLLEALRRLGITRLSLFTSGNNQDLEDFLDPDNVHMQLWTSFADAAG